MLQTAKYGTRYAFELIGNARGLADSLRNISENPQISAYLATHRIYSSSAMGLLGLMFYDMSVGNESVPKERKLIGRTASRIILLTDIVDDIIDKRQASLAEKFTFLDNVKSDLFGYSSHSSLDLQEEASYTLARAIYGEFLSGDRNGKAQKIFDALVDAIKRQFTEREKDELVRIVKTIGACCTDTTAVLTEIVTERSYPIIRESARKMGEYCELLDNWYELDNDLEEGVNTFPTVTVLQEGDTPIVRRNIKSKMLTLAGESFAEGFTNLRTKEQRAIYQVLKAMIDLKYKVVDRLH